MIFVLAELVVIATILGGIIVQVAVPLWNGTPLFPAFRRKAARDLSLDMSTKQK